MWKAFRESKRPDTSNAAFPSPSASADYSDETTGSLTAHSAGSSQLDRRASDYEIPGTHSTSRPDASSSFRYPTHTSMTSPLASQSPLELASRSENRSQSVSSISTDTSHSQQVLINQPSWSPNTSSAQSSESHCSNRINPRHGEGWLAAKEAGPTSLSQVPPLRKRGRPRKGPSPATPEPKRETKNRTKTGCITCRKRKKKCTEERPVCTSCQKNNYACVYPETEIYRTGKEKADEQARRASLPMPRPLPSLFEGVESPMDRQLLHHFIHKCSPVLSMNTGGRNLYLTHMLPMAAKHGPLMHALLALSASHLSHRPISADLPPDEALIDHQFTLHSLAIRGMRQCLTEQQTSISDQTMSINLLAILYTVAEGQTDGTYHQHVAAAKTMLGLLRSDSKEFCDFIYENLQYHATLSTLLADRGHSYIPIPRPNELRRNVRESVRKDGDFTLDSSIYAEAADIDAELRQWTSPFEEASEKWIAAQICQRATWAYLRRTMSYPTTGQEMHSVLNDALELFDHLAANDSSLSCLLHPMFLFGCCAVEEQHRAQISDNFDRLYQYSELRNVEITKDFIITLWAKMDEDVRTSWDWESLAESLHLDYLIT